MASAAEQSYLPRLPNEAYSADDEALSQMSQRSMKKFDVNVGTPSNRMMPEG
jgi:hypothetical protein